VKNRSSWGLCGFLWFLAEIAIAQSLGDTPTHKPHKAHLITQPPVETPLHTHQHPLAIQYKKFPTNKNCSTNPWSFLLVTTVILLRMWLALLYYHRKKTLQKLNSPNKINYKIFLTVLIFFSFPTLVEASPMETDAVHKIQKYWLAYLAYRTVLHQYTPTIPWSVRTRIKAASLNIRGGFDLFIKRSYIAHKCTSTDLDFMAIIDSNHKSSSQLQWRPTYLTQTPRTPPGTN
jgi:hypothetical protein